MAFSDWSLSVSGTTAGAGQWSAPASGTTMAVVNLTPDDTHHSLTVESTSLSDNVFDFVPADAHHAHQADNTRISGATTPGVAQPTETSLISGRSTVTMEIREGGKIVARPRDSGRIGVEVRTAGDVTMYVRAR